MFSDVVPDAAAAAAAGRAGLVLPFVRLFVSDFPRWWADKCIWLVRRPNLSVFAAD